MKKSGKPTTIDIASGLAPHGCVQQMSSRLIALKRMQTRHAFLCLSLCECFPSWFSFKSRAYLVGPLALCRKTNAFAHGPVGRPKSSDTTSGHTARESNRTSTLSERLLENREKGPLLDTTVHAPIVKKEHKSIHLYLTNRVYH